MKDDESVNLGDFMPRNFVDESTGHSVVGHLKSPGCLASYAISLQMMKM